MSGPAGEYGSLLAEVQVPAGVPTAIYAPAAGMSAVVSVTIVNAAATVCHATLTRTSAPPSGSDPSVSADIPFQGTFAQASVVVTNPQSLVVTCDAAAYATVYGEEGATSATFPPALEQVPGPVGARATGRPFASSPVAYYPSTTAAPHAATHASGGSDPVSPASIGAATTVHTHAEGDVTGLVADLAAKQAADATLTALAGLATVADKVPYFTGPDAAALAAFTAFGRSLVDDPDAATARGTLGAAATAHGHVEADVTNLVGDLSARPTGSGTAGKLPKWTAGAALGDSVLSESGGVLSSSAPLAAPMRDTGGTNRSVLADGAAADGKINNKAVMTSGSATLTISGAEDAFAAGDVGKTVWVQRAGAAGARLKTTIQAYVSPTQVTLAATAGATVLNARAVWGADSRAACAATVGTVGARGTISFPAGVVIIDGEVTVNIQNVTIAGQGPGATTVIQVDPTAATIRFAVSGEAQIVRDMTMLGCGSCSSASSTAVYWSLSPAGHSGLKNLIVREFLFGAQVASTGAMGIYLDSVDFFDCTFASLYTKDAFYWHRGLCLTSYTNLTGLSIGAGSATLNAAGATFGSQDIGKWIAVAGAGAAGATLVTTISAVTSATQATLAAAATTGVAAVAGRMGQNASYHIRQDGGGFYIGTLDLVGAQQSFFINPPNATSVNFGFATGLVCDSALDKGMNLSPQIGGSINSHVFVNCWFASAGADLGGGSSGSGMIASSAETVKQVAFVGCRFVNNANNGAMLNGAGVSVFSFTGCVFDGNSGRGAGGASALFVSMTNLQVTGCRFGHTYFGVGGSDYASVQLAAGTAGPIVIEGNVMAAFTAAGITDATAAGQVKHFKNNVGFNPTGPAVTTPAVPASTVAQRNESGQDVTVYLAGGTISGATQINGVSTLISATNCAYRLPANATITLTYTVAPTWKWVAD